MGIAASGAIRHSIAMTDSPSTPADHPPLAEQPLDQALLAVLARNGSGTLSPTELAQAIGSTADWHGLLTPIRRAAVALAKSGRMVIYRKGKPVDPDDFRGVYRLGLPRHD